MTAEREGGAPPGRRLKAPERGVAFFTTFLVSMVVGFLLVISGMTALGAVVFAVAIVAILAMMLTPSPSAREERMGPRRAGKEAVVDEKGVEVEEPPVATRPVPVPAPRRAPKPPPEAPPLEDLVVDVVGQGEEPSGEDGDVWV